MELLELFPFSPSTESFYPVPDDDLPPIGSPPGSPIGSLPDVDNLETPTDEDDAEEIAKAQRVKLDELMEHFTRGFDPGNFNRDVQCLLPMVSENICPGSYSHLLVILLQDWSKMQIIQAGLENGLRNRYQCWAMTHPNDTSITDEMYFGAEVEMLRKLLAPLRGDDAAKVYWMNTRQNDCAKVCRQLEASVKVIEEFKRDVVASLRLEQIERTIYSALPVSQERTALISMKQLRLDACKATLSWDGFQQSDMELTAFYQFYKEYVSANEPAKARASGWLPPTTPDVPHISISTPKDSDLVSWPFEHRTNSTLALLLKTALWLSVARGLAAVHLFCDIARMFTTHRPPVAPKDSLIFFLLHLTQIRVSVDGIHSRLASPFPFRDETLAEYNRDYFDDVWKSNRALADGLVENLSLIEKDRRRIPFKLGRPPSRGYRALRKELRNMGQTAVIRGSLAGTWPLNIRALHALHMHRASIPEENEDNETATPFHGRGLHRDFATPRDSSYFALWDQYGTAL